MPITSDITLETSKFQPENVTEATKQAAGLLESLTSKGPRWWEVGITKYREMRELGQTPLPMPVHLPGATDSTVPSREAGREIPIRVYKPDNGQPSKGDLPALVAASSVGSLPPALFLCGTEDPLLDETILTSSKWSIAGGEAIVKIYPGATHGFTAFAGLPVAEEARAVSLEFMQEKLSNLV
ncbi:hypothetical protein N7537_004586 [Penicillium hordei]|uniref:Alpha/beta hydrolase fold-3 domain-containing protein n=1 Tax=Penicillium hordei TaxID=40994 RepID=A0AAD6EBN9_9EURO|nr:uncharacterized protein N7537_004586 [Penicillium hordei]KAJ5607967.1 hypothetical protein N7537_004586 [Penicillium hordei]